jgi:hypothetical protein
MDLRVPKRAVTVELALVARAACRVDLFVAEHHAHDFRPEDVLDLLEDPPAFLPAREITDDGGGSWFVLNKDTVVWVALHGGVRDEDLYDTRQDVGVELTSGTLLRGELLFSAPDGHNRLSDHLNGSGRFLRLWAPDRVYLVNKTYVLRVVELGEMGA